MASEAKHIGGLRSPTVVTGPLVGHAVAFRQVLIGQGYARGTISAHLTLMSRVSRWLDVQGLPARALADPGEVDRFFAGRRAEGYRLTSIPGAKVRLRFHRGAPDVEAPMPARGGPWTIRADLGAFGRV